MIAGAQCFSAWFSHCQDGGGIVKFRWHTLHRFVVTKEFMIPRGLPGEVVTVAFGKVTQKRWPLGDIVARCEDLGLFEDQLRKVSWTPRVMD